MFIVVLGALIFQGEPKASCPGGKPGECAAGLLGTPCATCSDGKTWTGEECADCRDETFVLWATSAVLSDLFQLCFLGFPSFGWNGLGWVQMSNLGTNVQPPDTSVTPLVFLRCRKT